MINPSPTIQPTQASGQQKYGTSKLAVDERINWITTAPFFLMHFTPLAIFWTGITWFDVGLCFALYYIRMFFITGGYHRYFAHRSYKLSRVMQFLMAAGGATAFQKGPLWWAGHHRRHHRYSDQIGDVHSPMRGFWWSHVGWLLGNRYDPTDFDAMKDFKKFPEILWINKYYYLPPVFLAVACWGVGGWSTLVVGFFLSTVFLFHGTFLVNSVTHIYGRRRYATDDTSRNSMLVALLTCGEGWHNNHHYYQSSANQGFFWWEIDLSYYVLTGMSWLGLAKDLRRPPEKILKGNLLHPDEADKGMERVTALTALLRSAPETII
ncbi:MAG: acyl-CoA desaturase [Nitrospiria bacterium]